MSNNHVITRHVGNLRGFSTDSIFVRPPNVATAAINLQTAPDGTIQLRRGYQCQIGAIGGMGIGTFDDPAIDAVQTVCIGTDGFAYVKLNRQVYLEYNGQETGSILGITNANPAVVHSTAHGLIDGTQVIIRNVGGLLNGAGKSIVNNFTFTITVIDADHFSLNGLDSTTATAVTPNTGIWSIAFADARYLTMSIFVDPAQINAASFQSINCNIVVNFAAQVNGAQNNTNTITVQFGHNLVIGNVVQFLDTNGVLQQVSVQGTTTTSFTFVGTPLSVKDGTVINQLINLQFGKGFDVAAPYPISQFISDITSGPNVVFGLKVDVNGLTNLPAAFFQIFEPTVINSNTTFILNYWYWQKINATAVAAGPPLPGSANVAYQNSKEFENASMAAFDDVLYICNGIDFPQKYDGQTVYRAGMPQGFRPELANDATLASLPFATGNVYQYGTTFTQIDNRGHEVEGEISNVGLNTTFTVGAAPNPCDIQVTAQTLQNTPGDNWNNHIAKATGGAANVYGPDGKGFFYDQVAVTAGYSLKIGDTAYYADVTCAVASNGGTQTDFTLTVAAGHGLVEGDIIYFFDNGSVERQRTVTAVNGNNITINGSKVTIANNAPIMAFKQGLVFGHVGIVTGNQTNVNTINLLVDSPSPGDTFTLATNDIVQFIDAAGNMQQRKVTATAAGTITIDGNPVSVTDKTLIASTNQQAGTITIQRTNANAATLSAGIGTGPFFITNVISNNLRLNIYRSLQGQTLGTNGNLYLVASIPNDSSSATEVYFDGIPDAELQLGNFLFDNPIELPTPPPISKYVRAFGNQLFFGGGALGVAENSDRVFFSNGNEPEVVPLASNFFNVPNADDDVTGLGVAGTTFIVTKTRSLWAATGNFLSGDIEVVQIAPGSNIGCIANATIATTGSLMYFLHTNGVYALSENALYPTDTFGNPIPISIPIDQVFRETNFEPWTQYVLKRAVGCVYTKENQYLLFLPCEDAQTTIRDANSNSIILCYDYQHKNWYQWDNMNAAGGMFIIDDNLYFQERRFSGINGNVANLYKQHRFYRLIDHADHAGAQNCLWLSSWEDLGQPEVRKKFCRCVLLMDRVSNLLQYNNPVFTFSSYLNRLPNLQNTISTITQPSETRNTSWSMSGWGWNYWSGYQDSFVTINLKGGTVAKSIQVGLQIQGINMDMRLAGFQLEAIPENRMTVVR